MCGTFNRTIAVLNLRLSSYSYSKTFFKRLCVPAYILTAFGLILTSSNTYAQSDPRIGIEWELGVGKNNDFTKVAALDGDTWSDPASKNDQELLCSTETVKVNGTDFPLMKMTHDLGGGGRLHLRTLELVTAPIRHDDKKKWKSAFLFLKHFVDIINNDHYCKSPIVGAQPIDGTCYVSAKDVVDALNTITPDYARTGAHCGANKKHNPSKVGFYKTNTVSYENFVSAPNTQVNIELNLEYFGNKSKPIKTLFSNQDGAAYKSYSAARDRFSKTSRWDSPQVKGFYMLLVYSLNGLVEFELDWASRTKKYQDDNAANQGWMRKNNYDLYLKTPLNLIYHRLRTMGLLPSDRDPLAINNTEGNFINAFNSNYCEVIKPGSWFYQSDDDRYACKSYTIDEPDFHEVKYKKLAEWQEDIVTDDNDPMKISKPINPNPAPVEKTIATSKVVVEMRNTRHAINTSAGIKWDSKAKVYTFVDTTELTKALSSLQ